MNKISNWDTGEAITDDEVRVKSYLNGLFNRSVNLLQTGIKSVWVLEGEFPDFKKEEVASRRASRQAAQKAFEGAWERGDEENIKELRKRGIEITDEMEEMANEIIRAMGCR